jgi:Cu(I)/Ag(I) efflux system membrane protein CusA/SilA
MIARLIRWSITNRFLVVLATLLIAAWGAWSLLNTPLDALPDLSDVQVIIRTTYPGQAPQIVEDQVTFPLTTTMLSVPGAKTVRGFSFFGDSFVYVLFEDGTDLYWARSRVLEYLNQVQGRLPATAKTALGPDATGVGWIYEYAVVDPTGQHDLSQLRALQDWFLKYELKSVPNVAEVATVGGFVRQYQVVLDPDRLRIYALPYSRVVQAIRNANRESGGSVLELGEAEYMVRARGYLKTLDDFRSIPIALGDNGTPVLLRDVARIQVGPELRRGISELNGQGETVGGVVIMRSGKNALETIAAVKAKLDSIKQGLPAGVEIIPTYDRSGLIHRAIDHLKDKLIEEFIVVALVCAVFLLHLRSSLVAIVTLPLGVLAAFIVMRYQGVNANIMSLGGIAIAIGAMVDAAVVMIENAHKHIETWRHEHPGRKVGRPGTMDRHGRCRCGGRPCSFLQSAGDHVVLHSGIRTGSAGRASVLSACLHQDLRDGRRCRAFRDACSRADGLHDSRPHPRRTQQSTQPCADCDLPAVACGCVALSQVDAGGSAAAVDRHDLSGLSDRRRIHASVGRGGPPLHAVCAPRFIGWQSIRGSATNRSLDQNRA